MIQKEYKLVLTKERFLPEAEFFCFRFFTWNDIINNNKEVSAYVESSYPDEK